jgi:uncharacterized protein
MTELLLDISRMREARDRIERTFPPEAFDLGSELFHLAEPVALTVDISRDNEQFRLVGRVKTTLEMPCGRCLEPVRTGLDEPFDVLYLPHAKNTGEGELELEDDDLTTAYYRDHVIDLGQLMLEQFQFAVPMKPLCQPGCRGLCPTCGINLNTATCECRPVWEDPRLAALRDLKTDLPPRS